MTAPTLHIPMPMPGLNEIIGAAKSSPYAYASLKRRWGKTVAIYALAQKFPKVTKPAHWEYILHEPTRRRDPSNVAAGCIKIIEDALQEAGLLENDNHDWVLSIAVMWEKGKPGVTLTLR